MLLGAAPLLGSRFWEGLSWSQVSESHSGLSASAFLLITASGHICAHRARWPLGRRITHAESTEGEEDGWPPLPAGKVRDDFLEEGAFERNFVG